MVNKNKVLQVTMESMPLIYRMVKEHTLGQVLDAIIKDKEATDKMSKDDKDNFPNETMKVLLTALSGAYYAGYQAGQDEALGKN